jgi:co-chaperonin GroES (HSP10)
MNDRVKELYNAVDAEYDRKIRPLYPHILVRVLPKAQKIGMIYTPDNQNKTVWEGVVMEVYGSTLRVVNGSDVRFDPKVSIGDHVVFPHWAGAPYGSLGDEGFRLVDEKEIAAILEYSWKEGEPRISQTMSGA